MRSWGLIEAFALDLSTLRRWLDYVASNYGDLPYHNCMFHPRSKDDCVDAVVWAWWFHVDCGRVFDARFVDRGSCASLREDLV